MFAVFEPYLNNNVDTEKRTKKCLGVILQKPESMKVIFARQVNPAMGTYFSEPKC